MIEVRSSGFEVHVASAFQVQGLGGGGMRPAVQRD